MTSLLAVRALLASVFAAATLWPVPTPSSAASTGLVRRYEVIGHSVRGAEIRAYELGNPDAEEQVLVVGCIHGNECAGIPIARTLIRGYLPKLVDLFVIPDLNPDGFAAGTRQNGRGVDLNRNFPWHWHENGERYSTYYPGPRPLSEPETRIARRFVLDHRPDVTFWFHQHMDLVWASGGDLHLQWCYAQLAGIRYKRLDPIGGSGSDWINHTFAELTSTVIELPAGSLSKHQVARYAAAVRRLARWDAHRPRGTCPA